MDHRASRVVLGSEDQRYVGLLMVVSYCPRSLIQRSSVPHVDDVCVCLQGPRGIRGNRVSDTDLMECNAVH